MFIGDEYRILATQNKVLSIIKRIPPNIIGDGISTINELIKIKNQNPIRIEMPTYNMISVEENIEKFLEIQDFNLETIVEKEKQVFLLPHTSHDISDGGDTVDVTDEVHESVKNNCSKNYGKYPRPFISWH